MRDKSSVQIFELNCLYSVNRSDTVSATAQWSALIFADASGWHDTHVYSLRSEFLIVRMWQFAATFFFKVSSNFQQEVNVELLWSIHLSLRICNQIKWMGQKWSMSEQRRLKCLTGCKRNQVLLTSTWGRVEVVQVSVSKTLFSAGLRWFAVWILDTEKLGRIMGESDFSRLASRTASDRCYL